jgi:hypothetical protein
MVLVTNQYLISFMNPSDPEQQSDHGRQNRSSNQDCKDDSDPPPPAESPFQAFETLLKRGGFHRRSPIQVVVFEPKWHIG